MLPLPLPTPEAYRLGRRRRLAVGREGGEKVCRGPWWIEQWRKEGSDGMCVARVCGHGADRRETQLTQQCFWSRRAARETCAVSCQRTAGRAARFQRVVYSVTSSMLLPPLFRPWLCTPCASRKRLEATSLSRVTSQVCNLVSANRWHLLKQPQVRMRARSPLSNCVDPATSRAQSCRPKLLPAGCAATPAPTAPGGPAAAAAAVVAALSDGWGARGGVRRARRAPSPPPPPHFFPKRCESQ